MASEFATREFVQDNKIVVYRLNADHREAVKAWSALAKQTGDEWAKDQVYCSLQDFRQVSILSPFTRQYAKELNAYFLDKDFPKIAIAVVLRRDVGGYAGQLFLRRDLKTSKIERYPFFDYDKALAWLAEKL